ncbi:MAG TPA: SDR family oxidoreductase [Pseudogracilibacillus sp.]|nr:SDR family oxidoreductase [Pseudogracilibacillus sp.]
MDLHLKGKTVLVTGASAGIGKAIALAYAKEEATVYISSRDPEKLMKAMAHIREETNNPNVNFMKCDMKDKTEIEEMVQQIINKEETIDVLINNAGGPPSGSFLEIEETDWYHAFEQNLLSVVRASKQVIPFMQQNKLGGRIVNITSSSIKQSIDGLILSNTMRPGVLGLTKSLAREFADQAILANTVGPGKIGTNRLKQLMESESEQTGEAIETIEARNVEAIPMNRVGTPEEFAQAVVFLGSFANTYITGQSLIVDGAAIPAL